MILLIDIGNTRIKAVVYRQDQNEWFDLPAFAHTGDDFDPDSVWRLWHQSLTEGSTIDAIGLASVNQRVSSQLELSRPKWAVEPKVIVESQAQFGNLINAYPKPQNMGVDRWLAMIAASNAGQQGALVVDAGTALTLDWVNNQGRHIGGYILPGMDVQLTALLKGTERVFAGELQDASGISPGRDTPECVLNGLLAQSVAFILNQGKQAMQQGISRLVMTGGESSYLFPYLEQPVRALGMVLELRPRLVFEGLLTITRQDAKKS